MSNKITKPNTKEEMAVTIEWYRVVLFFVNQLYPTPANRIQYGLFPKNYPASTDIQDNLNRTQCGKLHFSVWIDQGSGNEWVGQLRN